MFRNVFAIPPTGTLTSDINEERNSRESENILLYQVAVKIVKVSFHFFFLKKSNLEFFPRTHDLAIYLRDCALVILFDSLWDEQPNELKSAPHIWR